MAQASLPGEVMDHASVVVQDPDSLRQCADIMRDQLKVQREMMDKQLEIQRQQMMDQLELQRTQMNQHLQQQAIHLENQLQLLRACIPQDEKGERAPADAAETAPAPPVIPEGKDPKDDQREKGPAAAAAVPTLAANEKGSKASLETFVRCHGLHTVANWVKNYRKHPAGWGALLMIHGIPEVTNRLRQKVQNYAVFAALFLAGSIKAMSGRIPISCPDDPDTIGCEIRKRVYTYAFSITIASHILTILIAMAFHNALNEAARDSDVYRMFAKGKGFRATWACQMAFRVGAASVCVGITAVAQESIGWEMVVWAAFLAGAVIFIYKRIENRLVTTATLCHYWREDTGGKPDPNDPYDLTVPLQCFEKKVGQVFEVSSIDSNMSFAKAAVVAAA
eukprot:TRINITY_DN16907_c0_g1_i1.p1 TRINITY_DN16907_c0_g1~~TRINITY_DN16907_c0_g1_i1.p1  ORF type:complete len:393 (-),score=82.35 TRINITY_DN16907_c0_g1_i1:352-1530(-)